MTAFWDRWHRQAPYCHLDEWQRRWFGERARAHIHDAGSFPVVQDRPFTGIEVIERGAAELVNHDANGAELAFRRLVTGEIYGFTALFCDGGAIYGVRAVSRLSVFMLAREDFTYLTERNPAFKEFFYQEAMARMRGAYLNATPRPAAAAPPLVDCRAFSAKLEKSIALIKSRYAEPLTLEEAASACGMSKFYYSRLFKSALGCSFKEYLNRVRIEAAKEMLRQDKYNISEACYAVGYNDLSYFSRVFKRFERQSPSDYRRALKHRF